MGELESLAIGGVVLITLITGLIQFAKSFFPHAPGNLWRALAFFLGVVGQVVVFLVASGTNVGFWSLATWASLVVLGLAFGLAAGKAYDDLHEAGRLPSGAEIITARNGGNGGNKAQA